MRKYLALARAEWLSAIQSKTEILVWVILEIIPLFVMVSLWISNKHVLPNYSTNQLVTYYVAVLIISRLTGYYFDENLQDEIRDGTFSRFLVKPIKLPLAYIPQNLGGKIFNTAFFLIPIIVVALIFLKDQFILPKPNSLFLFGISLIAAYLIRYSISVMVSSLAFFWEQSNASLHVKLMLESFAGGFAFPLSFYPQWGQVITNLLPFKYIYFVPASIFSSQLQVGQIFPELAAAFLWVIGLLLTSQWFWKKGLLKYSSVGG